MYHAASSSSFSPPPKSTSSDKARASIHSVQSPSSWSSLPHPGTQPPSVRHSTPLSPKYYPSVFGGETPSYHSVPLSPHPSTSSSAPLVHPLLEHDTSGRIHYDIAYHPSYIKFRTPVNAAHEQAFYPPTSRVRVRVPGFPAWSFSAENPQGVTLQDIFNAIYMNLHRPVGQSEYTTLPVQVQVGAQANHSGRTSTNRAEFSQGIKQLDCVCRLFAGLSLAADGSGAWNLNLVPRYH